MKLDNHPFEQLPVPELYVQLSLHTALHSHIKEEISKLFIPLYCLHLYNCSVSNSYSDPGSDETKRPLFINFFCCRL